MNKTLLVLRNEVVYTLTRPSFLITAFALPLIGVLIFLGVSVVRGDAAGPSSGAAEPEETFEFAIEGYVDPGGLIEIIPEDIPPGTLRAYPDEAAALEALQAGEITAYYLVPVDYVEQGELIYVHPEANLAADSGQAWVMRWVLLVNMLDGDIERAALAWEPMDLEVSALTAEPQRDEDSPARFYVPYAVTMVLYIVILMSSSLLLNSVHNERKNRVLEILMQSITPRQMLTGKIVGLGLTGLLQTIIWTGTSYTLLRLGGRTFNLPSGLELPWSILVWGLLFFLLGYAVYASLMASLGALVPNLKEASQATFVVILPMIVPMFFMGILITEPHGPLAVTLSLFPLTAPVAMMTRLAAGGVPFWQPLLAVTLLLGTAILIVRAVARMFHAQILLSGQPFSVRRLFAALLGRA